MNAILLLAVVPLLQDPAAEAFAAQAAEVQARTLDNGLRVLVLPRGEAPVASFHVLVETGAMDEELGLTGLAHFAEHMAFKGSRRIGAQDWQRERGLLDACDEAWAEYEAAATGRVAATAEQVEALREAFEEARAAADELSDASAFDRAVEAAGGLDQNASTGVDVTRYFVSLPSERLEQWFWLTREQLGAPVMREFYKERDVVMEERRMRTESNAFGALLEALLQAAFVAHPYRDSTIGHRDDLRWLDRPEMQEFWAREYGAGRMVIAVVGKVDPEEVFRHAQTYLGDLPRGELRGRRTVEPEQAGPREVTVVRPVAPRALMAWRVPALTGRSGLVHQALVDLLAGSNASRLVRTLVFEEQRLAEVTAYAGYPGSLDPTLFLLDLVPVPGQDLEAACARAQELIDGLAETPPGAREMQGVKRRLKMRLLDSLDSHAGVASALASAEALDGDWRSLFATLEQIDALSAAELQQAAAALRVERRTTARLIAEEEIE